MTKSYSYTTFPRMGEVLPYRCGVLLLLNDGCLGNY